MVKMNWALMRETLPTRPSRRGMLRSRTEPPSWPGTTNAPPRGRGIRLLLRDVGQRLRAAGARLAGALRAGAFLAGAFLAGAFFATAFLAGAFFATVFLATAFWAGAFLAGAFLAG